MRSPLGVAVACALASTHGVAALTVANHRLPLLMRVRGGTRPQPAASLEAGVTSTPMATVPPPALLGDVDRALDAQLQKEVAAPPDAWHVFAQMFSYLSRGSPFERMLLVLSLGALVLSKSLNVLVPFSLKRAVDALEASTATGAGAAATSAVLTTSVGRLLVVYVLCRFAVALANELRSVAY